MLKRWLPVLVLWTVSPLAAQGPTTNSCADAYWANTLRCLVHPLSVPQPTVVPPATPADVRDFTRVDLPDWNLRCADGTRPILYIDPAEGPPSNNWIFTFAGGGSCSAHDLDHDGDFENGQECADQYVGGESGEMGSASKKAMVYLGTSPGFSEGIHSPDLAKNPKFATYNRVRVDKCNFDRFLGQVTYGAAESTSGNYRLFQHGGLIARYMLDFLRGSGGAGLSFASWKVEDGVVVPHTVTLPPLQNADQVLFVGHSGGGHGLYYNAGHLATKLRSWPVFKGDIRLVIDANFLPAAENEVAFDSSQAGETMWSDIWSGSTVELSLYNGQTYYQDLATSDYVQQNAAWLPTPLAPMETLFDASCVTAHSPTADTWKCRSRLHVLAHHLALPIFLREDFTDPNIEHTASGVGHPVVWGPWAAYPHCAALGMPTCPPIFESGRGSAHEARLLEQGRSLEAGWTTLSELALGGDPSGPPPNLSIWQPDCGAHEGVYDDEQFSEVYLDKPGEMISLREALEEFVDALPDTYRVRRTSHDAGTQSLCGGGVIFADNFESGGLGEWSWSLP